jgi:hypothetical protein
MATFVTALTSGVRTLVESHLDGRDLHAFARERMESQHGHGLEECETEVDDRAANVVRVCQQRVFREGRARHRDALTEGA